MKNLTELERKLVLQRIAILENCKASKASVVIHIHGNIYVSRDNYWPYRLRGGADVDVGNYLSNLQESNKIMVNKAIENARYHGINLYHGVPNMADGNCAFESIVKTPTPTQPNTTGWFDTKITVQTTPPTHPPQKLFSHF